MMRMTIDDLPTPRVLAFFLADNSADEARCAPSIFEFGAMFNGGIEFCTWGLKTITLFSVDVIHHSFRMGCNFSLGLSLVTGFR